MARSLFSSTAAPCLKCHATGDPQHDKIATAPNFLLAKERLKPDWVERWITRSAGHQPGHGDAFGIVQAGEQSVGVLRSDAAFVPGIRQGPQQTAGRLHLPAHAGRTAAGGGVHGTQPGCGAAAEQAETGGSPDRGMRQAAEVRGRMFCFEIRRWSLAYWSLASSRGHRFQPTAKGQRPTTFLRLTPDERATS